MQNAIAFKHSARRFVHFPTVLCLLKIYRQKQFTWSKLLHKTAGSPCLVKSHTRNRHRDIVPRVATFYTIISQSEHIFNGNYLNTLDATRRAFQFQPKRLDTVPLRFSSTYRFANPRYTCSFPAGFTEQIKNSNETRLTDRSRN